MFSELKIHYYLNFGIGTSRRALSNMSNELEVRGSLNFGIGTSRRAGNL
jgi:hypothetical protein